VRNKVDLLIENMRDSVEGSLDVSKWSLLYGFDVMGDVGFSEEYDNMRNGVEHPAVKTLNDHIGALATMSTVPWLLNTLGSIPGAAASFYQFFNFCEDQVVRKDKASPESHKVKRYTILTGLSVLDRQKTTRRYNVMVIEGLQGKGHHRTAYKRSFD
jgi:hypothetical protein